MSYLVTRVWKVYMRRNKGKMGESSELAEKEKGGERELVTDHGKRVQIADGQGRGVSWGII